MRSAPDSARSLLHHALRSSERIQYARGKANAYLFLDWLDFVEGKKSGAKAMLAIKYFEECQSERGLKKAYNLVGLSYMNRSQYRLAYQVYEKALNYAQEDTLMTAGLYNNMALVLMRFSSHPKALTYLDKALKLDVENQDRWLWSTLWVNKAICYQGLSDYKESDRALDSAIALAKTFGFPDVEAQALMFRTQFYLERGQPKQAAISIAEARRLVAEHAIGGRPRIMAEIYSGAAALALDKSAVALPHLRGILAQDTIEVPAYDRTHTLKLLAAAYADMGNYLAAYTTHVEFFKLEDSLRANQVGLEVNEMETRYRTAEKDKELAESRLLLSDQKGRLQRQRSWTAIFILASLLIISLLTFRFLYVRQKHRRLASEQELIRLKARMEGEEQERHRIAHDLHDGVNSQLSASQSYLIALERSHPELIKSEVFAKLKRVVSGTSLEVRQVAHHLAPDRLQQLGLPEALREFCQDMFVGQQMEVELQSFGDFSSLAPDLTLLLYRIAQELLQNIKKHAEASHVLVMLGNKHGEVSLIIEDNGKGISASERPSGIGLHSLRERVLARSGTLRVESLEGGGTSIQVQFPDKKK